MTQIKQLSVLDMGLGVLNPKRDEFRAIMEKVQNIIGEFQFLDLSEILS